MCCLDLAKYFNSFLLGVCYTVSNQSQMFLLSVPIQQEKLSYTSNTLSMCFLILIFLHFRTTYAITRISFCVPRPLKSVKLANGHKVWRNSLLYLLSLCRCCFPHSSLLLIQGTTLCGTLHNEHRCFVSVTEKSFFHLLKCYCVLSFYWKSIMLSNTWTDMYWLCIFCLL